jgi:hypothetical protein
MYSLTEHELDAIVESGNYKTLDIGFFTFCAGALITVIATLVTVPIADKLILAGFVSVGVMSLLGTAYFGIRALLAWGKAKRDLLHIKTDHAS